MNVKKLVKGGAVAGIYAVLTMMLPSYTAIQFRLSEIMVLLAYYNPFYIIPLTIGCAIANIASPFGIVDVVLGSLATFLATTAMSKTKNLFLASLWPTIFSIIVALEITLLSAEPVSFLLIAAQLMISEFVVVTIIGVPVIRQIMKNRYFRKLIMDELGQ